MFTKILLLGCTFLIVSCSTTPDTNNNSSSESVSDAIRVAKEIRGNERLMTEIPEGFMKIRDSKLANLHIAEYLGSNTTTTWTEKLTVEAMQGDDLPDPPTVLEGLARDQAALCEGFKNEPIFAGLENGYQAVVKLFICNKNIRTGKPILTMIKSIKGNSSFYTVSRFWRIDKPLIEGEALEIDHAAIAAWSNVLGKTYACDNSVSEHPCQPPAN